jgi:hypothetical protein
MFKIDYVTYINHGGTLFETAYPVFQRRAGVMLDRLTFGHIKEQDGSYGQEINGEFEAFNEDELEALIYAVVAIIETMMLMDKRRAAALSGEGTAKSITSGGESITYESTKTIYDNALADPSDEVRLYRNTVFDVCDPFIFRHNPFYAGLESRWG